jgi:pimeloyl-ACP methyl ester carboxylesterase
MPYGHDWAVSDVTGGGCILMADFLIVLILSGIAIAGAAITLRYRSVMRAVRERIESLGSRVVRTDCGPIEYARAGSGYPVLVVHGNAGGFDQGLMLADRSIGPEFQVIAVSRFGYLGSPMPPEASVAIQADAFASLLDSLAIKQAAVVGYSAGSVSSIQFALRHPERVSSLILVEPVAPGKGPVMPKPIFTVFFRNDFIYWATITCFRQVVQGAWAGVPGGKRLTPGEKAEVRSLFASLLPVSARVDGSSLRSMSRPPDCSPIRATNIRSAGSGCPRWWSAPWTIRWLSTRMPVPWRRESRVLASRPCPAAAICSSGSTEQLSRGSRSFCTITWLRCSNPAKVQGERVMTEGRTTTAASGRYAPVPEVGRA